MPRALFAVKSCYRYSSHVQILALGPWTKTVWMAALFFSDFCIPLFGRSSPSLRHRFIGYCVVLSLFVFHSPLFPRPYRSPSLLLPRPSGLLWLAADHVNRACSGLCRALAEAPFIRNWPSRYDAAPLEAGPSKQLHCKVQTTNNLSLSPALQACAALLSVHPRVHAC